MSNKSIVEGMMFIPLSMGHDSIHRIKWRRHTRHVRTKRRPVKYCTVERLDKGHLYPLGRRRDKHVTGGARTSAPPPAEQANALPKELSRQLISWLFGASNWPSSMTTFGPLQVYLHIFAC